jgi:nicotinate-nucleotide pyrophosphorylase (carboxylating)
VTGLTASDLARVIDAALAEDSPWGDVTSEALIAPGTRATGALVAHRAGIVAGLPVAEAVFTRADRSVRFRPLLLEGAQLRAGDQTARVDGPARSILRAERVALNFLQRLSGIATLTSQYVAAVAGTGAVITDTRKTTPGLRALERYAVRIGGGRNHRYCLSDAVLVKDNHLAALAAEGLGLADAIHAARQHLPHTMTIEVEVSTTEQIDDAIKSGATCIMLDNFVPAEIRRAVRIIAGRALVEASGSVTLANVREIAETGVDLISVGALTHSAPSLDIGLDLEVRP